MPLSPFQKEKLGCYFKMFDSDDDGLLTPGDLDGFMKKSLDFTGWDAKSQNAKQLYEVQNECFFSTTSEHCANVKFGDWLEMWEGLIPGSMSMMNFPVWVRLLPKLLFRIIDSKSQIWMLVFLTLCVLDDGEIDEHELSEFYTKFLGIAPETVAIHVRSAMGQMTDNGRYPLTLSSFSQMFSNFLIGKTPYGPGRLIFGCFEHNMEGTDFHLIQKPPEPLNNPEHNLTLLNPPYSPLSPGTVVRKKYFRAG